MKLKKANPTVYSVAVLLLLGTGTKAFAGLALAVGPTKRPCANPHACLQLASPSDLVEGPGSCDPKTVKTAIDGILAGGEGSFNFSDSSINNSDASASLSATGQVLRSPTVTVVHSEVASQNGNEYSVSADQLVNANTTTGASISMHNPVEAVFMANPPACVPVLVRMNRGRLAAILADTSNGGTITIPAGSIIDNRMTTTETSVGPDGNTGGTWEATLQPASDCTAPIFIAHIGFQGTGVAGTYSCSFTSGGTTRSANCNVPATGGSVTCDNLNMGAAVAPAVPFALNGCSGPGSVSVVGSAQTIRCF